jgi:hypothetical protein
MERQFVPQVRSNTFTNGYGIERKTFRCLEINIPTSGNWMLDIKAKAEKIENKLNAGQANSSEERDGETIKIDNLSGLIAEYACDTILRRYLGKEKVEKPSSETSKNQMDIVLADGKRTIEVRSSCVKNGIDFALFAKPKDKTEGQYFDVIGPYSNGYKHGEIEKDLYMRVLYCCEKKNFLKMLKQPILTLYITGGATKEMMQNEAIYQIKHLVPAGGEVEIESDYRVIPLGKSLDIADFISLITDGNYTWNKQKSS